MLEIMSKRPMSVKELIKELRKNGYLKAPTTIRHHLELLKRAKLIELVKVKEVRGTILKYYIARSRFLGHDTYDGFEEDIKEMVDFLSLRMRKILRDFMKRYSKKVKNIALRLRPCPYCSKKHFKEFVIISTFQLALSKVMQDDNIST